MDELMDLLVTDGSASQISDQIKDVLFAKSAENIEAIRPNVAASIFDGEPVDFENPTGVEVDVEDEVDEVSAEYDDDVEDEVEYDDAVETEEE